MAKKCAVQPPLLTPQLNQYVQNGAGIEPKVQNAERSDEIASTAEEIRAVFRREPFDANAFSHQLKRWRETGVDGNATPLLRRLFAMLMQNAEILSPRRKIEESSRVKARLNADQLVEEITRRFTTGSDK